MNEYRIRATGAVVTETELRAMFPLQTLRSPIDASALDIAGADPVFAAPPNPAPTQYQTAVRNGVVQDNLGNWVHAWTVTNWTEEQIAANLGGTKVRLSAAIEAAVMAVYERPVRLAREYELREADALAYKNAGYTGDVGRVLQGFAISTGMTPTNAANLVLTQSEAFRGAELNLADLRMRKYEVMRATTVENAATIHAETMAAIAAIAAAIG